MSSKFEEVPIVEERSSTPVSLNLKMSGLFEEIRLERKSTPVVSNRSTMDFKKEFQMQIRVRKATSLNVYERRDSPLLRATPLKYSEERSTTPLKVVDMDFEKQFKVPTPTKITRQTVVSFADLIQANKDEPLQKGGMGDSFKIKEYTHHVKIRHRFQLSPQTRMKQERKSVQQSEFYQEKRSITSDGTGLSGPKLTLQRRKSLCLPSIAEDY